MCEVCRVESKDAMLKVCPDGDWRGNSVRYVVILSNEEDWYAPIVEAPSTAEAEAAAEDRYPDCTAVCRTGRG